MRKDVKLGFAIGGVLLAVLIVYVLVISGGDNKSNDVSLVTSDSQSSQTDNAGNKPPAVPAAQDDKSTAKKQHHTDSSQPPAPAPSDDPFKGPAPAPAPSSTDQSPTNLITAKKPTADDKWSAALNTGKLPVMMTKTPDPVAPSIVSTGSQPATPVSAESNKPTPLAGSGSSSGSVSTSLTPPIAASNSPASVGGSSSTTDLDSPTTRPTNRAAKTGSSSSIDNTSTSGARTHTVQPGETFSSIAASVYGSTAYWPHISRANPTIDARKLKAGMVINLPPASEVRADSKATDQHEQNSGTASGAESGGVSKQIDEKTEYRVVSGDSLYKISMKLYGKGTLSDKIYELNKTTIGENPAHLKLGMILKLPEAPTATASR